MDCLTQPVVCGRVLSVLACRQTCFRNCLIQPEVYGCVLSVLARRQACFRNCLTQPEVYGCVLSILACRRACFRNCLTQTVICGCLLSVLACHRACLYYCKSYVLLRASHSRSTTSFRIPAPCCARRSMLILVAFGSAKALTKASFRHAFDPASQLLQ